MSLWPLWFHFPSLCSEQEQLIKPGIKTSGSFCRPRNPNFLLGEDAVCSRLLFLCPADRQEHRPLSSWYSRRVQLRDELTFLSATVAHCSYLCFTFSGPPTRLLLTGWRKHHKNNFKVSCNAFISKTLSQWSEIVDVCDLSHKVSLLGFIWNKFFCSVTLSFPASGDAFKSFKPFLVLTVAEVPLCYCRLKIH